VVSLIDARNARSAALAERLGATREGVFHHPTLGAMDVWRHPGPAEAA
jgi:ribosomal-protein-alanine N-acetyltransferase